jgi:NitT/TauT family transport system permease protein
MSQKLRNISYPISAIIIFALLWEALARLIGLPEYILPLPSQVVAEVADRINLLFVHGWITGYEAVLGFLASIFIGVPIAFILALSKPIEKAITPILVFSQTFPKIAIAPLFVIWFGFGLLPKITVSFLIAFFPIVISTVAGLKSVEPEYDDLVRSMGASSFQRFVKIRIPYSLPYFFSGTKVAVAFAVIGAVVGEFIAAEEGLGYLILVANDAIDTTLMFAAFVALMFLGAFVYYLIEYIERKTIFWHPSVRDTSVTLAE